MKDMGETNIILGVKIIRSENGLSYIRTLYREVKKFVHHDVNPMSAHCDANTQ